MTALEQDVAEPLATALKLASAGYHLLPVVVRVGADGKKDPHFPVGWSASRSAADLAAWQEQHRPNVWAIACAPSGVDVVDLDPTSDAGNGLATYRDAGLPESVMQVRTRSAGRHHYFRRVGEGLATSAGRLPGADIRGADGIVFACGTLPDGRGWAPVSIVAVDELPPTPLAVTAVFGTRTARVTAADVAADEVFARPGRAAFTRSAALRFWNERLAKIEAVAPHRGNRWTTMIEVGRALGVFNDAVPGIKEATWARVAAAFDGQPGLNLAHARKGFDDTWANAAHDQVQVVDDPPMDPFGVGSGSSPNESQQVNTPADELVPLLSDSDLDELPAVRSLIKGVMSRGSLVLLNGMNQSYKSFVALDWALSIATGQPWLGRQVRSAEPVVYVAAEGAYGIRQRRAAWKRHRGVDTLDNFHLVPRAVQFKDSAGQAALLAHIERIRPALVVIDTVHQSAAGLNENDAGEMSVVMARARAMTQWGATVVLVHHTGHAGERARGSSSLGDDADEVWIIKRDEVETPGLDVARTMHHWKAKDSQLSQEIALTATPVETGYFDDDGDKVTSLVLGEDVQLAGSVAVLKACSLLEQGALDDDPAPARTATRGTNKDTVKTWLRSHHPEVRFGGRNSFWAEVVHHYKACTISHPEMMVSIFTERDELKSRDSSPRSGTSWDGFAPPAP